MAVGLLSFVSNSGPTGFALTDISSGRLFQRTIALTTGPVSASGTYSGGTPSAIELQVLKVSDNSVVKDWTTTTASIGGGSWSATVTGVVQGGSYYVKARPSNATGLAATGSNPFYVGIIIIMYGQSNMLVMSSTASSPPSASSNTTYFNGSVWGAVPAANGVREMLNALVASTSVPCAALNGSISGVTIGALSQGAGNTYFSDLAAQIVATGSDAEVIIWNQGEGDSANGTTEATYLTALDTSIHAALCTVVGRTKAQMPLFVSGLGTTTATPVSGGFGDDASWDAMERTLIDSSSLTNTFYSHSNRDRTLVDSVHADGASCGRSGKRFARSISTYFGSTSGQPHWAIASCATVDATHTTVDVTHVLGTDFTPTSGITGFEVSGDNGGAWVTPSAAVRTSATRITLTHSSLATDSNRKLRYQYGLLPIISAPVLDNSSLALPLDNSAATLSPTPLSVVPVPTYRMNASVTTGINTANVSQSGLNIVNAAADLLLIMGVTMPSTTLSSATITPNGGSPISATVVKTDGTNTACSIAQFSVPNGIDLTNATLAMTLSAAIFNQPRASFWTVPQADLNSLTAVDSKTVTSASANALSITTLTTSANGFVIAISNQGTVAANSNTWSGTETFAERYDLASAGLVHTGADASGTGSGSSTVTSTWTAAAAAMRVTAASWR